MGTNLRATEHHLSYVITWCYLAADTDKRTLAQTKPDRGTTII